MRLIPEVDCLHVAQIPKDRLAAALPAPSREESWALIPSITAFAVFDYFATPPITANKSGRFIGVVRMARKLACKGGHFDER
jgi:hypothetical protein